MHVDRHDGRLLRRIELAALEVHLPDRGPSIHKIGALRNSRTVVSPGLLARRRRRTVVLGNTSDELAETVADHAKALDLHETSEEFLIVGGDITARCSPFGKDIHGRK